MKRWLVIFVIFFLVVLNLVIYGKILNQKFMKEKETAKITLSPTPTLTPTLTPTPTLAPSPTPTPIPTKPPIVVKPTSASLTMDEMFVKYGGIYGVDPATLRKIAGCESGFNPNAISEDYGGLFQFSSLGWTEARGRLGADATQSLRFNAEEAIRTAAHEIQYKGTSGWSDCD